MIKKSLILLLALIVFLAASCATTGSSGEEQTEEPAEYETEEFPEWLMQVRRAEIIFTGSFPISILLANVGYSLYSAFSSGLFESYSIDSITGSSGYTDEQRYEILSISLGISGGITLVDFIIGLFTNAEKDE